MEHSEIILDQETPSIVPSVHLRRSLILLRFYAGVVIVFVALVLAQIFLKQPLVVEILSGLTGFGVFFMFGLSPVGIVFALKAIRRKEKNPAWHLVCHVSVLVAVGLLLFVYLVSPE
jgi:hypothetical protein